MSGQWLVIIQKMSEGYFFEERLYFNSRDLLTADVVENEPIEIEDKYCTKLCKKGDLREGIWTITLTIHSKDCFWRCYEQ